MRRRRGDGRTEATVGSRRGLVVVGLGLVTLVGLVGASCGSQAVPAGSGGSSSTTAAAAVVSGSVVAGPSCPVQSAAHPCSPQPVGGVLVEAIVAGSAVAAAAGHVAGQARAGRDGSFTLTLPAGSYDLEVRTTGPFPRCAPVAVTVTPGARRHLDLTCDTGIR
jgi:hypothetical protein